RRPDRLDLLRLLEDGEGAGPLQDLQGRGVRGGLPADDDRLLLRGRGGAGVRQGLLPDRPGADAPGRALHRRLRRRPRGRRPQVGPRPAEGREILVLLPDSGSRYLSKVYDDQWLKENSFLDEESRHGKVGDLLQRKRQPLVTASPADGVADIIALMK